ncbi:MAG: 1-acyl-sn-glycerol-3-phosphate acyltransferase [Sphingomicrobium sp.]
MTIEGEALAPHTLALANHVSWLDILILGGATGAAFVSKAEIGKASLVGWLADQNHTLYIERAERGDAHGQVRRIAERLAGPQPLSLFPEGTTSHGRHVLPFLSTLLAAVAPPPQGTNVRPVAIDYGEAVDAIGWFGGEAGLANFMRVLGRRGTIPVTLRLLGPLPPMDDRKALARAAHDAVAAALTSVRGAQAL